ncbi:MAG: PAS domain-containing protein [Candidatus Nealsonbacteria bacterium]|nr:PAS domain-containing protein [Candidatus Nealsonbacteria bacterium]
MNGSRFASLSSLGALTLSAGWAVAWSVGLFVPTGSWPVRLALLGVGVGLSGGCMALWIGLQKRRCLAARRHFEAICELDFCGLSIGDAMQPPAPLPTGHPLESVSRRLLDVYRDCIQRMQELKHTRTAWEIRYRRAVTEHERIKSIFSGLAEPILAVDDFGDLVLANAAVEELLHFDSNNPQQRALDRLVHCEKLVALFAATSQRKTSGRRDEEIEIADETGQTRWYRVTADKVTAQGEKDETVAAESGSVVAVFRDISEQKVLQRRNAEFVSAVSHEMKTPLAGIKAYVELLVDGDAEDEETQEEFLQVINSQADRLERLVDNMLNLARIEAGVVKVSKETRSLNELLEEAANVVQPAAEKKQIRLATELSPMYLGVLADRDMLLQSAINLLSNAVKYTPDGGTVTLRSRMEDGRVRFEVEDNGVGLDEEDCRRVFEKFYRVSKDKDMAGGTGLGLPLAKHIVEDVHGGTLAVESTPGQGSIFSVTMPDAGQLT